MKSYRVGIIGLGRMGSTIDDEGHTPFPYSVAASCQASPRFEIAAGCDLRQEKRDAFRERWGVEATYDNFEEMVRQEKPDLVAICTTASGLQKPANEAPDSSFRGDSHAELAVALADAGVPMLYVEKAMASSMRGADDIRDAVKRNGTVFNIGVLRRFDSRYDPVRDIVLRGDIGEPKAAVHYARSSLMHGHIHSIDTLSWLMGDPGIAAVRGEFDPRDYQVMDGHIPFDPVATYQLCFENGVYASSVPASGWEFEIIGSEGTVRSLSNGAGISLRTIQGNKQGKRDIWEETSVPALVPSSTVVACLEDLVTSYEAGERTRGHIDVTHHITEACIGIAESQREHGKWIDLPLEDRDLYIFHI